MKGRIRAKLERSAQAGPRFRCGHSRHNQEPDGCRDCYLRMYGRARMKRKRRAVNPRIWFREAQKTRQAIHEGFHTSAH